MSRIKETPTRTPKTGLARAIQSGELAADIRGMIEAARLRVAQTVNAELVLLNWQIGNRIRRDILGQTRAEYGEEIVSTLSRQLSADYDYCGAWGEVQPALSVATGFGA